LLRLIGHACWLLASHGISPAGPFPLVCATCQKPWPCPEITWAADWILAAQRLGFLDDFGLCLSDNVLAIVAAWGSEATAGQAEARLR